MHKTARFAAGVLMLLLCFTGCGEKANGLATDSGEMTLEEFKELQATELQEATEGMSGLENSDAPE